MKSLEIILRTDDSLAFLYVVCLIFDSRRVVMP